MKNGIEITGLNGAVKMIEGTPKEMGMSLGRIMKEAALVCMDYAKRKSPVITGRYRASIHVDNGKVQYKYNDDKGKSFDGTFSERPGQGEIFVGTNVEYAGSVEAKHHTMDNARVQAQWFITTRLNEFTR